MTTRQPRVLISAFALLSPYGFRHRSQVRTDELKRLAVPTLLAWGDSERSATWRSPEQRPI